MVRRILLGLVIGLLLLVAVILFNTFTFKSIQSAVPYVPAPEIPPQVLTHLTKAISYQTISYEDTIKTDTSAFLAFHEFLREAYPLAHEKLDLEVVAGLSLLYRWEGKDKLLNPIILMAHQDVVPIEEETRSIWTVDPFEGVVKDGFIWGRGAADDKINLIAILESVESLVKENYQPDRTVYLAFGHDEETGGKGAMAMAALLKSRNVRADLILDEGGIITNEKVPGMTRPVALLGTSEKGYLSLVLSVEKQGGHSSMPEDETAIDILTRAINKVRDEPFEARFSESTEGFISSLGPEMPFVERMAFANIWLFRPMVNSIYEQSSGGNAMIRTTVVPTIIRAGVKDNVVPTVASATVNIRLLPGDDSEKVISRIKEIMADDRIRISRLTSFAAEPSQVTSAESFAYHKVDAIVKRSVNDVVTTPFLMIGGTDSRHFGEVSDGIIKFSPMTDPIGFHGIDERVSLESFRNSLWFFEQLLRDLH
jgi:carboxypeptidase PM20D1